jgi:BNR repeat-like domain
VVMPNEKEFAPIGNRGTSEVIFSRSRDGGKTFDIANKVILSRPDLDAWIWNVLLVQLKDGTLVLTHALPFRRGTATDLVAWRSTDQGETWSGPRTVRHIGAPTQPSACGADISGASGWLTTQQGQAAVRRGSTVALVTVEDAAAQNGPAKIIMSTSTNGGIDWRSKTIIRSRLPITMQSIAANRHGQLGVVYDQVDVARANCSTSVIPARTIFRVSSDNGRTWSSTTVGPRSWNFGSAANNPLTGWWIGEFQSLAATPRGFTTITPQGAALTRGRNPRFSGAIGVMVANITTCPRRRHSERRRCSP